MNDNFMIKERIRELIKIIYKYNNVGGSLHIVLDNYNFDDEHIQWCLNNSISKIIDRNERDIYEECATLSLKLSYSARKRLLISCRKR